nr:MAG TPA: hypothetical protein [Caudoviricetes sp.]
MDAVEYLESLYRMCTKSDTCDKCPIYKATGCNCGMAYSNAKMLAGHVGIVEQWAKEHPARTRQSVFLEQYPKARRLDCGGLDICPREIEGGGCDEYDERYLNCVDCKRKYWNQEVRYDD